VNWGVDISLVQPAHSLGGLREFVDMAVPELLRRCGHFRAQYERRTLRDNLGLPRPASRLHGGRPSQTMLITEGEDHHEKPRQAADPDERKNST
jgi:hypothetical protein